MTGKTKLQARRRAREAQARANEDRATRERENVEDAATYVVAADKLREIDAWEVSRLAAVCEQVRREAETRRTEHRAASRAALTRMQRRGETLTMITELTGESVAVIRATLRRAPSAQDHTAPTIVAISGASDDVTTSSVMVAMPTPVKDTASSNCRDRQE